MRKIRRPNVLVKPREVFYQLKRNKLLGNLDEATIEEIIGRLNPAKLVDPGLLYENFETQAIENKSELVGQPLGSSFSLIAATIGDKGFEAKVKNLKTDDDNSNEASVVWAWGEVMLTKVQDFANDLALAEAQAQSYELGPNVVLSRESHPKFMDFVWTSLKPKEKLEIQAEAMPVLTKIWLAPWLTKKEKKQLALQQ